MRAIRYNKPLLALTKCVIQGFRSFVSLLLFTALCLTEGTTQVPSNKVVIKAVSTSKTDSLKTQLRFTTDHRQRMILYSELCLLYSHRPALPEVRHYHDSAQALAHRMQTEEALMLASYCRSILLRTRGDAAAALENIIPFLHYAERRRDSAQVARALYQLSNTHTRLGNFEQSLAASFRALAIYEKSTDLYSIGITLAAIGIVQVKTLSYEEAKKSYQRALQIFEQLGEKSHASAALINLGDIAAETGTFEEAKQQYLAAMRIDEEIGKERGLAFALSHLGNLFDKTARYDSALVYQLKALTIRQGLEDKDDLAQSLNSVGLACLKLGQFGQARNYLDKALTVATASASKPVVRDVYHNLSKLAEAQHRYEEAYRYQQAYLQIRDSILSAQTGRRLSELQTKYETGQKDQQIALLEKARLLQQKETERQEALKKLFRVGLFLVSLSAILLFAVLWQRMKNQKLLAEKNQQIRELDFQRQQSELEMKALRARINPHFLFNCMNAINGMILQGETRKAAAYLGKFAKLVRLILENAEASTVSLEDELALLEAYLQLESLRLKNGFDYRISVADSIEPASTYLPSMVLQPFVENAIWHGLSHKEERGWLAIDVKEEKQGLRCIIEDNGVGREKAAQCQKQSMLKRKSMGMKITEERLQLLRRENDGSLITVVDLKDESQQARGTRVEVCIPAW